MSKHTSGPWSTLIPNGRTVAGSGKIICDMSDISMEEEQANARLIAAAPTMLDALKAIYAALANIDPKAFASIDGDALSKLDVAIELAEGKR